MSKFNNQDVKKIMYNQIKTNKIIIIILQSNNKKFMSLLNINLLINNISSSCEKCRLNILSPDSFT